MTAGNSKIARYAKSVTDAGCYVIGFPGILLRPVPSATQQLNNQGEPVARVGSEPVHRIAATSKMTYAKMAVFNGSTMRGGPEPVRP